MHILRALHRKDVTHFAPFFFIWDTQCDLIAEWGKRNTTIHRKVHWQTTANTNDSPETEIGFYHLEQKADPHEKSGSNGSWKV